MPDMSLQQLIDEKHAEFHPSASEHIASLFRLLFTAALALDSLHALQATDYGRDKLADAVDAIDSSLVAVRRLGSTL